MQLHTKRPSGQVVYTVEIQLGTCVSPTRSIVYIVEIELGLTCFNLNMITCYLPQLHEDKFC